MTFLSFHLSPWVWLLVCMCTTCMQVSTKARRGHTLPGTASGSGELPDVRYWRNKPWSFAEHSASSAEPPLQPLSNYLHTLFSRDNAVCSHMDLDLSFAVLTSWLNGNLSRREMMEFTITFLQISMLLTCSSGSLLPWLVWNSEILLHLPPKCWD